MPPATTGEGWPGLSPLPSGEVDLRSKSDEGYRSIEGPQPLTRRYAIAEALLRRLLEERPPRAAYASPEGRGDSDAAPASPNLITLEVEINKTAGSRPPLVDARVEPGHDES